MFLSSQPQCVVKYDTVELNNNECEIDFELLSDIDGKLFYLVNEGDVVEIGTDIAIVGNLSDTREDVLNWYKKMR